MRAACCIQDLGLDLREKIADSLSAEDKRSLARTSRAWFEATRAGRYQDRGLQRCRAEEVLDAFIFKCKQAVRIDRSNAGFLLSSGLVSYPHVHNLPPPGNWYRDHLLRTAACQHRKLTSRFSEYSNVSWQKKIMLIFVSTNVKPVVALSASTAGLAMSAVALGLSVKSIWLLHSMSSTCIDNQRDEMLSESRQHFESIAVAIGLAIAGEVVSTWVRDKLESLCCRLHNVILEPFVANIVEQEKKLNLSLREPDLDVLQEAHLELDKNLRGVPILGQGLEGKKSLAVQVWTHIARVYALRDVPQGLKDLRLSRSRLE